MSTPETRPKMTDAERQAHEWRKRQSKLMRLVAINAYAAYCNTLVGNAAPKIAEQFERSSHPQAGDVVLETSTIWKWAKHDDEAPRDQYPALGVLLRTAMEPYPQHEDGEPSDAREMVYYIAPLDGSVPEYRWTNANFIRVMSSPEDFR